MYANMRLKRVKNLFCHSCRQKKGEGPPGFSSLQKKVVFVYFYSNLLILKILFTKYTGQLPGRRIPQHRKRAGATPFETNDVSSATHTRRPQRTIYLTPNVASFGTRKRQRVHLLLLRRLLFICVANSNNLFDLFSRFSSSFAGVNLCRIIGIATRSYAESNVNHTINVHSTTRTSKIHNEFREAAV
uniref:Uncharacterized protein n=1 Tax=Trichogramma kaykai TaxID=54128 RepID=A0ABD2WI58_9HYME